MDYKNYRDMSYEEIAARIEDPESRWDYFAAMRGPDTGTLDGSLLKTVVTTFLRGKFEDVLSDNGSIHIKPAMDIIDFEEFIYEGENLSSLFRDIDEADKLISKGIDASSHFTGHLKSGLEAVRDLGGEVKEVADILLEVVARCCWLAEAREKIRQIADR